MHRRKPRAIDLPPCIPEGVVIKLPRTAPSKADGGHQFVVMFTIATIVDDSVKTLCMCSRFRDGIYCFTTVRILGRITFHFVIFHAYEIYPDVYFCSIWKILGKDY